MTLTEALKRHDGISRKIRRGKVVKKWAVKLAKPVSLFAMMFAVTLGVVTWETGCLHKALNVAAIASPAKFAAASLHAWFWGGH